MTSRPAVPNGRARRERVAAALAQRPAAGGLCSACREVVPCLGVGITLVTETHRSQLCVSDDVTATLEELQFTVGQGPSVDACDSGRPVMEADLAGARAGERWPAFAGPAAGAGIRALSAFPLGVGAGRLGVLSLYDDHAGGLGIDAYADGLVTAVHLTHTILAMQAQAPPHLLADGLASAGTDRAEVHQASGMISVQLGITVLEALARLRSNAYATGRPIGDIAADVVARRLRLEP